MGNSKIEQIVDRGIDWFLSPKTRTRSEQVTLTLAIASYLLHLSLIFLVNQGVIHADSKFLNNPISAIYTPFSFILVYEVYMLIFYLPKSTTFYIGKQYEIITLIVIRRIFKDIGNLELLNDWFQNKNDLQFTYDVITSLVLFLLIYLFYQRSSSRKAPDPDVIGMRESSMHQFIFLKKIIALLLVPVLLILALYSLITWVDVAMNDQLSGMSYLMKINNVFFEEFFTVLIVVDVLLLLASFFYSDRFHTIMRNSGFVISTILIKMSFSVTGILNNAIITCSLLFGLLILVIHNLYADNRQGSPPA